MENINELESLKNAINAIGLNGIDLIKWAESDSRKTKCKYVLQFSNGDSSPKLAYNEMNHFIWGMITLTKNLKFSL